jgi:hypothetical protein
MHGRTTTRTSTRKSVKSISVDLSKRTALHHRLDLPSIDAVVGHYEGIEHILASPHDTKTKLDELAKDLDLSTKLSVQNQIHTDFLLNQLKTGVSSVEDAQKHMFKAVTRRLTSPPR